MICPRCGRRFDGAGEGCSVTCEQLHAADRDVPHYDGRNACASLQESVLVPTNKSPMRRNTNRGRMTGAP